MSYQRPVYECAGCRASTAPLNREGGLAAGRKMSQGLVRKVAWCAADQSFCDAAAHLLELTGIEVSPAECGLLFG